MTSPDVPNSLEVSEPRLFDNATPESVVAEAEERFGPFTARVCLFSGGNDSLAVAHRCREFYDMLVFVDTGTAVPGVREFVERAAEWLGKPLSIYETPRDEYARLVLGGEGLNGRENPGIGFPGPMMHGRCYNRLKERQIEAMRRDFKRGQSRMLALTGVRRAESQRRALREPITTRGSLIFCNPLIDWTNADLHRYRRNHDLIESDVAALLHRSGECNCGAYAAPGEREDLIALFPEWWESFIAPLEVEAKQRGLPCVWGSGPNGDVGDVGELCSDCQLRIEP